mgnify:FL=1
MLSNRNFNPLPSPPFKYATLAFTISIALRFLMMLLLSLGFSSYNRLRLAEKEKLKTELSYLKAQINPHFLFNTLNSIYALTVKRSDSAPESVTRLASIMRYVITDASLDKVSLEKEIHYISAYIDLEKLRLTNKVKFKYELKGDFAGVKIAPMIFLPLIENAFKYGVSTHENSEIDIQITREQNIITFLSKNTKLKHDKNNSTGLGLKNVKKRLELIYGGKHEIIIHNAEDFFSVKLSITLND